MSMIRASRIRKGLSQRELARKAHLSLPSVQQLERGEGNPTLSSLEALAQGLGQRPGVVRQKVQAAFEVVPDSAEEVSMLMVTSPDAWKVHLFDFVDRFRGRPDTILVARPPSPDLSSRLAALLAGTVEALCSGSGLPPPPWCAGIPPLPSPWFVSGRASLKAMALAESPAWFRKRNVFVLANFLERA